MKSSKKCRLLMEENPLMRNARAEGVAKLCHFFQWSIRRFLSSLVAAFDQHFVDINHCSIFGVLSKVGTNMTRALIRLQ